MIFNNEIRIQRKIIRRIEFLFILDSIRRNTRNYNKKENKKKNTTSH